MFKGTYLRPIDGHRVFAIQPGINIQHFIFNFLGSIFTLSFVSPDVLCLFWFVVITGNVDLYYFVFLHLIHFYMICDNDSLFEIFRSILVLIGSSKKGTQPRLLCLLVHKGMSEPFNGKVLD